MDDVVKNMNRALKGATIDSENTEERLMRLEGVVGGLAISSAVMAAVGTGSGLLWLWNRFGTKKGAKKAKKTLHIREFSGWQRRD